MTMNLNEVGIADLGSVTIRKIEPAGNSDKVVWLHLVGFTQAIKTMTSSVTKLGLHDGAQARMAIEVITNTYKDQTTNVPWLKFWDEREAILPKEGSNKNGNGNGSYSKDAARIRAIGDICTHAPLNELAQRIALFKAEAN